MDISHEALLTAWPLLRDTWLADARADRIVRARLRASATEWVLAFRDPSYLYSGTRLDAAVAAALIEAACQPPSRASAATAHRGLARHGHRADRRADRGRARRARDREAA